MSASEDQYAVRAAQEYYYLLHDSNPGALAYYSAHHPQRVCSASVTGPREEDGIYLLDTFVSPALQQLRSRMSIAKGAAVRMEWSEGSSTMLEFPRGSPLVLIKTFAAKACDAEGNVVCRYEMRAIKRLARWGNGSLMWPLKVAGKRTLVELQKV